MEKCTYIVRDTKNNTFIGYADNQISSDCWTVVRNNATRYNSLKQAQYARRYMAKICKISPKDLYIEVFEGIVYKTIQET